MNGWKLAFFVCFALLIGVALFGLYSILDQGVTITHMREGYNDTESDLETIIDLINRTDLSKDAVHEALTTHRLYEYMDFSGDTIHIERTTLVFVDGKLRKIEKQW